MRAPKARDFAALLDRFEQLEKRVLKLEKAEKKQVDKKPAKKSK